MGDEDHSVIRVVVVDDDEILLHGVHSWLAGSGPSSDTIADDLTVGVIATAKSVTELLGRPSRDGLRPQQSTGTNALNGVGGGTLASGAVRRNNGVARPVDPVPQRYPPARSPMADGQVRLTPVALLDLRLRDGRRVAENVAALIDAGYAVVTCSTIDDAGLVHEAGRAGALAYVRKSRDAHDMRHALAAAARGERYVSQSHAALIQRARSYGVPELSGQEREALRLYASGLTMSSVARRLNVKQGTAKSYLDRVRDKYEQVGRAARTKLELRDRAVEDGVLNSLRLE
jgi:two-component system nitrate/nitrite response regulator NarL